MIHDDAPPSSQPIVVESDERYCESCGYNLAGLVENRCPECGTEFNRSLLPGARIPWLRARQIGPVRAFVLTVWQILSSPGRFANEICSAPRIDFAEAVRFKRYCLLLGACGTSAVFVASLCLDNSADRSMHISTIVSIICFGAVIIIPAWLFVYIGSAIPVAIREAGSRADQAGQCLAMYACANAVFLPLVVAIAWIGIDFGITALPAWVVGAFFLITWWLRVILARIAYKLDPLEMIVALAVLAFWWLATIFATVLACIVLTLFLIGILGRS